MESEDKVAETLNSLSKIDECWGAEDCWMPPQAKMPGSDRPAIHPQALSHAETEQERQLSGFMLEFVSRQLLTRIVLPLLGEVLIGRGSVRRSQIQPDVLLDDETVNAIHAKIVIGLDYLHIRAHESTDGFILNGEKVKSARLKIGDRMLIGRTIIKLAAAR